MRKILGENFECLVVVVLLVAQVEDNSQHEAHERTQVAQYAPVN